MADIKTPFSDAIETSVPTTGSGSGKVYEGSEGGGPSRTGGLYKELYYDNVAGAPSNSGPVKTPFKDTVGK